jgi:hypothetical protein
MSKIRMNTELRNKLFNKIKNVFENEDTQEREGFLRSREIFNTEQSYASTLAKQVVERAFDDPYYLDVIGTSYCRSRAIACTKDEYTQFENWRIAKANVVSKHQTWIDTIQKQCDQLKIGLKAYRYLSEGIELATELGIQVDEAELIRTNSTGLTIYNPSNLASMIKGMKNKQSANTREAKILARKQYEESLN